MTETLAKLEPSLGRRWFGVIVLALVGFMLAYLSFFQPPASLAGKILLPILAMGFFWQAQWNWRVTKNGLYLTHEGIFDGNGTQICAFSNIRSVDRGLFAFKPSNGFLVRMHQRVGIAWAPGVYWRLGKRLGIGGVTQPAQAKAMADIIDILIRERSDGPEA